MKRKLQIGDRVACVKNYQGRSEAVNMYGRVVKLHGYDGRVGIEFDEQINGHNCQGKGEHGKCWNIPSKPDYLLFMTEVDGVEVLDTSRTVDGIKSETSSLGGSMQVCFNGSFSETMWSMDDLSFGI